MSSPLMLIYLKFMVCRRVKSQRKKVIHGLFEEMLGSLENKDPLKEDI